METKDLLEAAQKTITSIVPKEELEAFFKEALKLKMENAKMDKKTVALKCYMCGEWQIYTRSGMVCKNGHGGVQGLNIGIYEALTK